MTAPFLSAENAQQALARLVDEFAVHPGRFVASDWAGRRPGPRILSRWLRKLAPRAEPELQLEACEVAFWVTELGPLILGPAHADCCRADPATAAAFDAVAHQLINRAVATDMALRSRRRSISRGGFAASDPP